MKSTEKKYYIRDIENHFGVERRTLFYWEKTGKIPQARREVMSNYRYWTEQDFKKLKKIIAGG